MILKKKSKTFNDYDLQISWGQLEVLMAALERDHADPVADELYAELQWYQQRVPGPGEEEDEAKAREQGAVETGAQTTGDVEGEDVPIPMPPAEGAADTGEAPPPAPGEEGLAEPPGGDSYGEDTLPAEGEVPPPDGGAGMEGPPPAEGEGELEELPAPPAR